MTRAPLVTVSTRVMSHEIGQRCVDAVQKIFPDFLVDSIPTEDEFPVKRDEVELVSEGVSPELLLELLGKQRILDTALDAMSLNIDVTTVGNSLLPSINARKVSSSFIKRGKFAKNPTES